MLTVQNKVQVVVVALLHRPLLEVLLRVLAKGVREGLLIMLLRIPAVVEAGLVAVVAAVRVVQMELVELGCIFRCLRLMGKAVLLVGVAEVDT
jgi:hypothetical protein